ncbi:hypothetical protein DS909_08920 [Phaeobacter gallaeciensis]|uniref:Uncharacterized protein n=1 Tax=Phaeobacter gallaeciensis TaxID=60890 RepID=A0A366X0F5_9RHOB|nr:hypothetical protein [Phaeobacter gallaeciensis]RBW56816.1 hypothetical protein DS909_08920 [Phaeobacter gallaeciensis]
MRDLNLWGPVSWLVDPPDAETITRLRADHARDLGFDNTDALDEAEGIGNAATHGDPAALVARRYIRRDIARVAQSRRAAAVSRRSKWDAVKPEALAHIERIRASRSGLKTSSVADLVLDRLSRDHDKIPGRSTIIGWVKDFDG